MNKVLEQKKMLSKKESFVSLFNDEVYKTSWSTKQSDTNINLSDPDVANVQYSFPQNKLIGEIREYFKKIK